MNRFTGHGEDWGAFVDVKYWSSIRRKERYASQDFFLSSVTGSCQPCEERYGRTDAILAEMKDSGCTLSISTKLDLALGTGGPAWMRKSGNRHAEGSEAPERMRTAMLDGPDSLEFKVHTFIPTACGNADSNLSISLNSNKLLVGPPGFEPGTNGL